jgi:hypothetical protein
VSAEWILYFLLAANLVSDVIAWRRGRREHREYMEALRRNWRARESAPRDKGDETP